MFKFYFYTLMSILFFIGVVSLFIGLVPSVPLELRFGFICCGAIMIWAVDGFVDLFVEVFEDEEVENE